MAKYKVEIVDGCISCGVCANECPETFEMRDTAIVIKPDTDELECSKNAADNCPVNVIHITDTEIDEKII